MPNVFVPLGANATFDEARAALNANFAKLDSEAVTKTYKQPGGNAIVEGKLPYEGGYGFLIYDADGVPSIIIGILPDGTVGIVAAKEGENVLDAFS